MQINNSRVRLPGGFNMPPFGIHQYLALMIVAVALWAIGSVWLGLQGASQWVGSWQQQIALHVYVDTDRQIDLEGLEQELAIISGVGLVQKVSKDDTLEWMRKWLGDTGMDAKMLSATLPVTFVVTLNQQRGEFSLPDLRDTVGRFSASLNEDELQLVKVHDVLERVNTLVWFATVLLGIAMALIVSNTLRMILLARMDEVRLMRLLGAKEWFVRMPFILEGLALGAGAGGLAWLMLWPLVLGVQGWLATAHVDVQIWGMFFPLLLGGGLVGGLGSVVATAKLDTAGVEA
ncbi:MAG: hypothetical protein Q9M22_03375 [Mariprofundaceae bacterium]|nr:hypothetical protein [Mariprofundaceae bacterium]